MTTIVGRFATNEGGYIEIVIRETSYDVASNTSQVFVSGNIYNKGSKTSTHTTANISAFIDSSTNDGSYTGPPFAIGVMPPGGSKNFINRTFTVTHNPDGSDNVAYSVHYGVTGTTVFGDNQSIGSNLVLTQLATEAAQPNNLQSSNILPTSFTLTWDAPSDDGGFAVSSYKINQYVGTSATGSATTFTTSGLTRNMTGLTPGQAYTYTVAAYNGHGPNNGYSDPSDPLTVTMTAGCWIRKDGVWHVGIPYVRTGGHWKMALPFVRVNGEWKATN